MLKTQFTFHENFKVIRKNKRITTGSLFNVIWFSLYRVGISISQYFNVVLKRYENSDRQGFISEGNHDNPLFVLLPNSFSKIERIGVKRKEKVFTKAPIPFHILDATLNKRKMSAQHYTKSQYLIVLQQSQPNNPMARTIWTYGITIGHKARKFY